MSSSNLAIVIQDAPGQFSSQPVFLSPPVSLSSPEPSDPRAVIAGDFDGDGELDVVGLSGDTVLILSGGR